MYKVVVRDRKSKKVLSKTVECSDFYENVDGSQVIEMADGSLEVFDPGQASMKVWSLDIIGQTVRLVSQR